MTNAIITPDILRIEHSDSALELLRNYYGLDQGGSVFTGASFELIGQDDTAPFEITAADLVALSTLSVPVGSYAAIELMSREFRADATRLLKLIPVGAAIDDADAMKHLAENGASPAAQLWSRISAVYGMGAVSTSKLLARKRPALIPVYDNVIDTQLNLSGVAAMWSRFHEWVNRQQDGSTLIDYARQLAVRGSLPAYVTPLRVIDVVLWMDGRPRGMGATEL